MYLGWKERGSTGVWYECASTLGVRARPNISPICDAIDVSIATEEGEILNDKPDVTGDVSPQSITQRSRASEAAGVLSLLRALSQHFIFIAGG
jgi:hypothetical protein